MLRSRWIPAAVVALSLAASRPCPGQDAAPSAPMFVVQSAKYEAIDGTGAADVTKKVQSMVKDGRLSLKASNKVLGGDPTPGHRKRLRVQYILEGKPCVVVVDENRVLAIPPIPPWQQAERLIPVLKSDAPLHRKRDACRQLALTGGKEAVPVLSQLLADEKLSDMARYALERIPDPAVDHALRSALARVKGRLLVGVIQSIGVRRDANAVDVLTKLMRGSDPQVASAAAGALSRIGTRTAVTSLQQALADGPKGLQAAICDALLRCADAARSRGNAKEAQAIYDRVRGAQVAAPIRAAALRGAILARGSEGAALLVEQLRSSDPDGLDTALRVALELPGRDVTQALAAELPRLPAQRQPMLIRTLSARRDAAALPALLAAARRGDKRSRLAAIRALPEMGRPAAVEPSVGLLGDPDRDLARAAAESLAAFPGAEADAAVARLLDAKEASPRLVGIDLVARRRMKAAMPQLLAAAGDPDQSIRLAALKTLAQLGGSAEIPALLARLTAAEDREDRDAAERALSAVGARAPDPDACARKILAQLAQAQPKPKVALLRVLVAVGGGEALQAVRAAVDDPNADVHAAAIRALGAWNTTDAAPFLLEMAKASKDTKDQLLCLRSSIGLAGNRRLPVDQRLAICEQGERLIKRDEERKLLLGTLGGITHPKALALAMPYVDRAETREEACVAIVSVSERLMRGRKGARENAKKVAAPLRKVAEATSNADLAARAKKLLK